MEYKQQFSKVSAFFDTRLGKNISKWSQRILFVLITLWMVYELSEIGWIKVWNALPITPYFYLIFLMSYFQLPLFEVWIYRITWVFQSIKSIPTFIIKRVYNKDVLGYSGEIYFYVWARKHLTLSDKEILVTIKDNNIISSIASTIVSVLLLAVFIFIGDVPLEKWFEQSTTIYWVIGIVLGLIVSVLLYRFRNKVIHMRWKHAFSIFGIQLLRLTVVQALNLLMFYTVMPETPFYVWFTYLSIEIILSRIPLIPNKDFIFVSMSISLAGTLAADQTQIAGLMLARSGLGKIMNFIFFAVFSFFKPETVEKLDSVEDIEELKES